MAAARRTSACDGDGDSDGDGDGDCQVHGWFLFGKPALSINNVELLKQLQVKDFNHFVDRNEYNLSKTMSSEGGRLDKVRLTARTEIRALSPSSCGVSSWPTLPGTSGRTSAPPSPPSSPPAR